jgi:DNA (cytosine-5)-methyltransferase 1
VLNGLDLFSGIGGLTLALGPWVRPVAYCEIDAYARAVLLSRMQSEQLPVAPIWDDVRELRARDLRYGIDIVYGGFPCQDLSVAGRGAGLAGERSGLFFEIARLVGELRPRFVFLENVPAIRSRGADVVAGRLAELGYDCRWDVLSAFDVGAPHLRERWWMLAFNADRKHEGALAGVRRGPAAEPRRARHQLRPYAHGDGCEGFAELQLVADAECPRLEGRSGQRVSGSRRPPVEPPGGCSTVGYTNDERLEIREQGDAGEREAPFGASWWAVEPDVGRVAHGVPKRVDRLRALGNAVVPAQAREAFARLLGVRCP